MEAHKAKFSEHRKAARQTEADEDDLKAADEGSNGEVIA